MKQVLSFFGWLRRPQAVMLYVALCLSLHVVGGNLRDAPLAVVAKPRPAQMPLGGGPPPNCAVQPCVALTFDDGPNPLITPHILDILARQQVKATFFVVGQRVAGQEALLKRAYSDGHEIGNHTWNHTDLSKTSAEQVEAQLQTTQAAIAAAGVPAPRLLRPPYGSVNGVVAAHSHLTIVRWNVDPEDWREHRPEVLYERLISQTHPGAIVLLHDIYYGTADALEPALLTLKQQYHFVTVSQLLNLSPGDQGQYFGRPSL